MNAKKLPSGSWRVQVFDRYEEIVQADGTVKKKRLYKSFTCDDKSAKGKRKCEAMAAEWAVAKERKRNDDMTFGEAVDGYISSRTNVISPRTLMDYKRTRRLYLQDLMPIRIDRISQEDIQNAINKEAEKLSPKTVKNIHGLLTATFRKYRPDFQVTTTLPQKKVPDLYIPTDEEIQKLVCVVAGTEMEIPVLLAAFGPMRRGEIAALHSKDINGNVIHVCRNMVLSADKYTWIYKQPKSTAGDRYILFPSFVIKKIQGIDGKITQLNPNQITSTFPKYLRRAGLNKFRFHDLRHYSASIQHALGIADVYIQDCGGWSSDGTLKNIYRHALSDKIIEARNIANTHFEKLCNTDATRKLKKP